MGLCVVGLPQGAQARSNAALPSLKPGVQQFILTYTVRDADDPDVAVGLGIARCTNEITMGTAPLPDEDANPNARLLAVQVNTECATTFVPWVDEDSPPPGPPRYEISNDYVWVYRGNRSGGEAARLVNDSIRCHVNCPFVTAPRAEVWGTHLEVPCGGVPVALQPDPEKVAPGDQLSCRGATWHAYSRTYFTPPFGFKAAGKTYEIGDYEPKVDPANPDNGCALEQADGPPQPGPGGDVLPQFDQAWAFKCYFFATFDFGDLT